MLAKITPSKMGGKIKAIPSKSYAHRILLAAMLSLSHTKIAGATSSKDIEATIGCIQALGTSVKISKDFYFVESSKINQNVTLDCIESGSTLRFIIPIVAALGVECNIIGREGLAKRPLDDLLNVLKLHGEVIDNQSLPIHMSGKITSGKYEILGNVSSQYITGLLMALPILDGDSELHIIGDMVSSKYIDITLDVLEQFKIKIEKMDYGFYIKGNQKYIAPSETFVQGDWSNAAFWFALGALNGNVDMEGLSFTSVQGDREIMQIISDMGGKISMNKDIISIKKSNLNAISLDAKDIPDLVPIVSILMAASEGISIIKNVDRLKIKESDRLSAIIDVLKSMGIKVRYQDNELMILGDKIKAFKGIGYNDHRMVMMQAIAASISDGVCTIDGIEAVNKSYPKFFEDYKTLGGVVSVK